MGNYVCEGACDIMIITVGSKLGYVSSNPEQHCLHFI